ncbi:MAG: hypothetical protein NTV88_00705 [Candidatus Micrarchaeota archaeon]|nr:hypothetical protein [Candidatus Micrarchaeota archaeon]
MNLKTVLLVALFATAFMLAYGCAGNQPGAGLEVKNNDEPPPPPSSDGNITFKVIARLQVHNFLFCFFLF